MFETAEGWPWNESSRYLLNIENFVVGRYRSAQLRLYYCKVPISLVLELFKLCEWPQAS
jgi:hypothetical protein